MRKLYPLLSVLFLIYWGCEDEQGTITLWGKEYSIENTTELDLGSQGLTGSIPPEIGSLTNLRHLYLYNNQFTGSIPSEIGNLTNLTSVSLYDNQLTGEIPSEIGNLTNLERIKLHSNQFTGSIPETLCNLPNLTWSSEDSSFSVSTLYDNQLCPPYPSCIEDYVGEQDTSDCD